MSAGEAELFSLLLYRCFSLKKVKNPQRMIQKNVVQWDLLAQAEGGAQDEAHDPKLEGREGRLQRNCGGEIPGSKPGKLALMGRFLIKQ